MGFVDIHHHIIYGMDDGAKSEEDMRNMLLKASADGITTIVATPHVTPGVHHFDWDRFDRHMEKARSFIKEQGIDMELYKGCEILYTDPTRHYLEDDRIPSLAGTENVLVEFSPDIKLAKIEEALDQILSAGYTPVIAHMERYYCLLKHPKQVDKLRDNFQVKLQVNCRTVIKSQGFWGNRFVKHVFEEELVDALGTDAHNTGARCVCMKAAYQAIKKEYGSAYAHRLTNGSVLEG